MSEGNFFGLPVPIIILIAVAVILAFVLRMTVYGRNLYAIGANVEAARLVGIRNNLTIFSTFLLTGILAGGAGLMLTSQLTAASPIAGIRVWNYLLSRRSFWVGQVYPVGAARSSALF